MSKTLVHEQALKESSACKAPAQVLPQKMGCVGRPEEVRPCMRRCFSTLCHTCARAFLLQITTCLLALCVRSGINGRLLCSQAG